MKSHSIRDVLLTAGAPLLWGTTYIASTQWLPSEYPLFIAAVRALPIGLILLCLMRELPRGAWWWRSALLGFFNIGLFFALLFVAAVRLPGGVAACVGALQPLLVVFLVWGAFGERPHARSIGLAILGLAGVVLLVFSAQMRLDTLGVAAAIAGTVSMAVGTVLTKRWGRPTKLLTFTSWQLVAGGVFLLPLALLLEGVPQTITTTNLLGFVYLALFNTGLAYTLWFRGIERLPTTMMPLLGLLSPVMAFVVGYLALDQTLTWRQLLGVVLILASVLLSQRAATAGTTGARSQEPESRSRNGEFRIQEPQP